MAVHILTLRVAIINNASHDFLHVKLVACSDKSTESYHLTQLFLLSNKWQSGKVSKRLVIVVQHYEAKEPDISLRRPKQS